MAFRCLRGPVRRNAKCPDLYEISDEPQRKEFLDDLFSFMQKRALKFVNLKRGSDVKILLRYARGANIKLLISRINLFESG
ncbi:unnamed protein product [Diatraea saccharalis]|uniref:Uncharacterized protein n=1 Tax=Diatraea saccharalis TaxID=40085 RepID=A0A9N9WKT4_9NEOP|nr:unnamed protein product [Diatraea saccharalis]